MGGKTKSKGWRKNVLWDSELQGWEGGRGEKNEKWRNAHWINTGRTNPRGNGRHEGVNAPCRVTNDCIWPVLRADVAVFCVWTVDGPKTGENGLNKGPAGVRVAAFWAPDGSPWRTCHDSPLKPGNEALWGAKTYITRPFSLPAMVTIHREIFSFTPCF